MVRILMVMDTNTNTNTNTNPILILFGVPWVHFRYSTGTPWVHLGYINQNPDWSRSRFWPGLVHVTVLVQAELHY